MLERTVVFRPDEQVNAHSPLGYLTPEEFASGSTNVERKKALPTFAQLGGDRGQIFAAKLKSGCCHLVGPWQGQLRFNAYCGEHFKYVFFDWFNGVHRFIVTETIGTSCTVCCSRQ
jgi:hypothetical protein